MVDLVVSCQLLVIFEEFAKLLSGEEYSALHSTEGHAQLDGNFFIFITGDVHRERLAVVGGEFV